MDVSRLLMLEDRMAALRTELAGEWLTDRVRELLGCGQPLAPRAKVRRP